MRHQEIREGQTLRLKAARAAAYGLETREHTVTAVVPRPGYSVPWVHCGALVFAPSDFERAAPRS